MAKSLTTLAKIPEFIEAISRVPPCRDDRLAWSLPSAPPGNTLTFILPPDLASTISANFFMPRMIGWPSAFWLANLMVLVWACATPKAAMATQAARVFSNSRFIFVSRVVGKKDSAGEPFRRHGHQRG